MLFEISLLAEALRGFFGNVTVNVLPLLSSLFIVARGLRL